ncbi:tetratricopeptide repeat protein [Geothermobacter ehrlichii]|uniref:tetratricopeptide repeat protein n=1 Tax=Geothermobacter ehrlichii TaxID=213224 RepID=UPI0011E7C1B6|nr:tetratricopeptide repeat protein [Geothermobacter ehrlichii]
MLIVYWQSFHHPWALDDGPVILQNPDIQSWQSFLKNARPGRPVRELSLMLDRALWGMDPTWWHVQQLFWHVFNGVLVWVLGKKLGLGGRAALLASLFFLLHPVQVEVVANLANRKDSLALAGILVSVIALLNFQKGKERQRFLWLALAFGAGLLACGAKQTAIGLLLLWPVIEYLWCDQDRYFLLRHRRLFASALGAGLVAVMAWYLFGGGREQFLADARRWFYVYQYFEPTDELDQLLMVLKSSGFLAWHLVWPLNLAPDYIYPPPAGILEPRIFLTGLGWIGVGILLLVLWRKRHPAFFSLLWVLAFWLPVSGLWPISYFAADRYLYIPLVGLAMLLGGVYDRCRKWERVLAPLFLLWLVALAGLSFQQNRIWLSPERLWKHAVEVSPESSSAWNNLGLVVLNQGHPDTAASYFAKAISLNPYNANPYYNLGLAYEKQGNLGQALVYYRKFVEGRAPGLVREREALRQRLRRTYGIRL